MLLRYSPKNMDILIGMDSLNPKSAKFLNEKLMCQLVDHYGADTLCINKTLLQSELRKYKSQTSLTAVSGNVEISINHENYPNLMKLFHLKRSLPVSSAEAERSFSTMKRVKNSLRNRLTNKRMSDLCLLSAERDLTEKLEIGKIIDLFSETKTRRVALK